MRLLHHIIFALLFLVKNSSQSQCIVSEWGSWSKCHGGCQKGLIVRNRDVLQPPLLELTLEGKMMQRLCPHLYETRYCEKPCEESFNPSQNNVEKTNQNSEKGLNYQPENHVENPVKSSLGNGNEQQIGNDQVVASASNLVERQMKKVGFGSETEDTQAKLKRKFISETEELFKLDDAINRRYGPQPSDSLVDNNNNTQIIDISTQRMSNRQWKDDMQATKWPTSSFSSYQEHVKAFTSSGRLKKYKPNNDHSVSALLRRIEQALDTNQPLDEKYIRSAMRRNKKLSKILVDAYRQKQKIMNQEMLSTRMPQDMPAPVSSAVFGVPNYMTSTTSSVPTTTTKSPSTSRVPTTPSTTPATTTTDEPYTYPNDPYTTTTAEELVDMSATTAKMLYWPKTGGYVPNTRKHASEITSQLYMTNQIIQTLADDPLPIEKDPDCEINKRCCKVIKNTCSDGVDPKFVKRWYRPKGSSVCVPYHYPRCSSMEEMEDLPILFEQNCQDLCFSQQEKRISPLFTLEAEDE